MSEDNNHITYTAADIEKYWKGELSAAEQHNMEKAALDDPFLADAMEGYEKDGLQPTPAIIADNDELKIRLAKRISEKQETTPVIKFGWWKVAAALVVLIGAGWLFTMMNNNKSKDENFVKNKDVQLQPAQPAIVKEDTSPNTSGIAANMDTVHDVAINKPRKSPVSANKIDNAYKNKPTEAESDLAVVPAPVASATEHAPVAAETIIKRGDTVTNADKADDVAKLGKKRSVTKNFSTERTDQKNKAAASEGYTANNNDLAGRANNFSNTFSGNVIDQANKPVANAFIQIPNLNVATKTDKKGYFSFDAADTALSVSVQSVGFETQNIHLNNKDATLNQIVLTPVPNNLQEVVVQSNGAPLKKQPISIKILDAEPVIGWTEYNAYLEKNKRVSYELRNTHGTVTVSFEVHNKWLNNFKIEQSLEEDLDTEAIRLIREGPAWKLLKGKKADATVTVKF